jgi:hypothetical protein
MSRVANTIASFFIGMACVVHVAIGMLLGFGYGDSE